MTTPYVSMLRAIRSRTPIHCILERRSRRFMFGAKNYGDIPGYINPADGDPWDVIVPGYPRLSIGKQLVIKSLEGVLLLENGNHKLIVNVCTSRRRLSRAHIVREMNAYKRRYTRFTGVNGILILP